MICLRLAEMSFYVPKVQQGEAPLHASYKKLKAKRMLRALLVVEKRF